MRQITRYIEQTFEDLVKNTYSIKEVEVVFEKGDKVWVKYACDWNKGVVREVFSDGAYLVRIRGVGLERMSIKNLEKRTGCWEADNSEVKNE